MGKAELKWNIGDLHYHLERKTVDLGAGHYSAKQVWELSMKRGDGWSAKWQKSSDAAVGATRDEMIQHLAKMFDKKPREVECLIEKAEENAYGADDSQTTDVRKHYDVPRPKGGGIPTRPLPARF